MKTKVNGRKMYLGGRWVSRVKQLEVRNPENNELIDTVPLASAEDMREAIKSAQDGAKVAAAMPVHQRIEILRKAAEHIENMHEDYAIMIAREGSKTIREARSEVTRCIQTLRISAEEARRIHGETIPFDQMPGRENRVGYYYRFPVGVIGAITPFNDPLNLVAHKVGPAIASGNAIIIKPASHTPLSALLLAEAFHQAGLPPSVLSVVTGRGRELGEVLITHPAVRMISFTGGLETGRAISHQAGLKKISMELGSNSPAIVLDDARLSEAVEATVSGSFAAAGQNCLGVQRIYVQEGVYNEFKTRFVERTLNYETGNKLSEATDMGPLISVSEAKRVEEWVIEAVEAGATLLCGGERNGAFYEPTVLTNVPDQCTIAREEIFGPVVLIEKVADLDTAIDKANGVDFGLQAGIFTQNVDLAFYTIRQLHCGGVMVNDSSDFRIDAMPFGGVKGSGLGREGVRFSIEEMTEPKVVCFKLT